MANSGHSLPVIRKSLASGLKGHIRKVDRCVREGKPFHRTAAASARSRKIKILTAKQSWFKGKPESDITTDRKEQCGIGTGDRGRSGLRRGNNNMAVVADLSKTSRMKAEPTTVLFCEYSKGGDLQSKLKGVAVRLAPLVGFHMKVTERGGRKLGSLLSNKNLWSGMECGRQECKTCIQTGDKREDCVRRNILYESEKNWLPN